MTFEELKSEAEEWVNKNKPVQDDWEDSDIIQAIIDTSEPREKRIAELEKEKQALFESNCNVRSKLRTLGNDYEVLDTHCKLLTEENAEWKELLKEFICISKAGDEVFEHDYSELIGETEQFLKEV